MSPNLRIISLGAGVQSTTMYLLAVRGEIGPMPDRAIFADTQAEPPWVYEHLEAMRRDHGSVVPIDVVTAGNLEQDTLGFARGARTRFASLPLRVRGRDGKDSILRRQCTREYKIEPIKKRCREILGLKPHARLAGRYSVEEWVGISSDEAHRAKPSRFPGFTSRFPLLFDRPMRRSDCVAWLRSVGAVVPQKSACYFCPFHDDRTWAQFKRDAPEVFARAVAFDAAIRRGKFHGVKEDAYLHRSLKPLDQVEFTDDRQGELQVDFGNECEGRCGV